MNIKRCLKVLIIGMLVSKTIFSLNISSSFDQVLKAQNFKIEKNDGNVLVLKNGIFILKLSPIKSFDEVKKELEIIGTENLRVAESDVVQYKDYYYYSKIIPLNKIESSISVEILYPKSDAPIADKWRMKEADLVIENYLKCLLNKESLNSEYYSLLKEYKTSLDIYNVVEKSLNGVEMALRLPSAIKNLKTKYFPNETSFEILEKRNEFWINSDTQKYANGKVTLRDSAGDLIVEQEFAKGLPNGNFKSYYEGGKNLMSKGKYIKGEKEGTWIEYYENSNKKEVKKYKNGKLTGDIEAYYENKKLSVKGQFENGKREGKWVFYYENGEKKQEGRYEKGNKIKKWRYYNTNGKLREEIKHSFSLF